MTNLNLELIASRRRIETVLIAEQKRLSALGYSSYGDIHIRACKREGLTEAQCSRVLKPTFAQRLLQFLRDS